MLLYVDDLIVFGMKEDINDVIKGVSTVFNIKTEGKLNDFLGCEIIRVKEQKKCYGLQPHLIRKLKRAFTKTAKRLKNIKTPETPRKIMRRI